MIIFTKKIRNFFRDNNLSKFELVIDVGAHKGESIVYFLENFDVKNIISFEPSPINFEILKKNCQKFKSQFKNSNISLENFGLASKKGILQLNQHYESSSSTIIDIKENSNYLKKISF